MKRVLALVLSVVLGACFLSTEPQADLVLSMEMSTTHVRADSGLVVKLTAFNPTDHEIRYDNCPRLMTIAFVAPTSDAPTGMLGGMPDGCAAAVAQAEGPVSTQPGVGLPITIPPGGAVSQSLQMYFEERSTGPRWPAGQYRIRGLLWSSSSSIVQEVDSSFTLTCRFPDWTRC